MRRLDVLLSVSPAYEEGRIVGAASIARDNTEHKRLEETLPPIHGNASN